MRGTFSWLFVIDRDPAGYFHFVALQSETARRLLAEHGGPPPDLSSIVLVEEALDGPWLDSLHDALALQPPWSDIPKSRLSTLRGLVSAGSAWVGERKLQCE